MIERRLALTAFLTKYLPDFCWMTAEEIYLFVEQEDEDVDFAVVRSTLHKLKQEGRVIARPFDRNDPTKAGKRPFLYLRAG